MNCVSVRESSLGKNAVLGRGGDAGNLPDSEISDKMAHVGDGCIKLHFCQKAGGALHFGVVTIKMGFLRCPKIERRRLQSVPVSGVKVRSQLYARSHAFESCLLLSKIWV